MANCKHGHLYTEHFESRDNISPKGKKIKTAAVLRNKTFPSKNGIIFYYLVS